MEDYPSVKAIKSMLTKINDLGILEKIKIVGVTRANAHDLFCSAVEALMIKFEEGELKEPKAFKPIKEFFIENYMDEQEDDPEVDVTETEEDALTEDKLEQFADVDSPEKVLQDSPLPDFDEKDEELLSADPASYYINKVNIFDKSIKIYIQNHPFINIPREYTFMDIKNQLLKIGIDDPSFADEIIYAISDNGSVPYITNAVD